MKEMNSLFKSSFGVKVTLLFTGLLLSSVLLAEDVKVALEKPTDMTTPVSAVEGVVEETIILNPRSESSRNTIELEHEKLKHITVSHQESERIKLLKKKQSDLVASLLESRGKFLEISKEIDLWEKNQVPTSELSHSEEIMQKAKSYSFSKRLRKKLQENTAKMSTLAAALDQNMKDIKAQQSLDDLLMKIKAEKQRIAEAKKQLEDMAKKKNADEEYSGIPDINDYKIKLYTVTERSSLKKLAGNPDLYSDGGMWKVLEKANRALIKRLYTLPDDKGDIIVPAGETILVPRQEEVTDFYKEEE